MSLVNIADTIWCIVISLGKPKIGLVHTTEGMVFNPSHILGQMRVTVFLGGLRKVVLSCLSKVIFLEIT